MAVIQIENGKTYQQTIDINRELASLEIQIQHWPTGNHRQLCVLLSQEQLNEHEQKTVLQHLDRYFQQLQETGYQSRDLMILNDTNPELDILLTKFQRAHTHATDEVRYVIAGAGIFGFVRPDGSQVELTVEAGEYIAGEYIKVPAGTEHWFYLTTHRSIKTIRYFREEGGWTPSYTNTTIRMGACSSC
jgi:1,2-dihydroxy-3-keto-5-methylthiopentene dioxygenase